MKRSKAFLVLLVSLAGAAGAPAQEKPKDKKEDTPVFNPLRAAKSIEVGRFYLRKGKYQAAIDRFRDAAAAQPGLALPYKLMGETYEKVGENREAIRAYQKYLELYPSSPEGEKVRRRIRKLKRELRREAASNPSE